MRYSSSGVVNITSDQGIARQPEGRLGMMTVENDRRHRGRNNPKEL
jgi:hypothetical protein